MSGLARPEFLATTDWLAEHLGRANVRILDARWRPDGSAAATHQAGHIPGSVHVDWLTELVDITATLCDLAEVEPPRRQFGRSLLPLIADGSAPHRDAAFTEGGLAMVDASDTPPVPFPYDLKHGLEAEVPLTAGKVAAIRTHEWTYVHRVHEGGELYDRRADPAEARNLIGDPAHAAVAGELRHRLLTWQIETADVIGPADPRLDLEGALLPQGAGG